MLLTEYDEQEVMDGIREEEKKLGIRNLAIGFFGTGIPFKKCLDMAIELNPTISKETIKEIVQSVYK